MFNRLKKFLIQCMRSACFTGACLSIWLTLILIGCHVIFDMFLFLESLFYTQQFIFEQAPRSTAATFARALRYVCCPLLFLFLLVYVREA